MRRLWTGEVVNHRGEHYTVQNARIYTLPDEAVPVYISGYGPQSVGFAAEAGDGYVTTRPDRDLIGLFRDRASSKPVTAGGKACVAAAREEAEKIAHATWSIHGLPGELNQILPTPAHFEQAAELVRPEQVSATIPCGPDPETHISAMRRYKDAGVDERFVAPVGPHYREMITMYEREVIPALASA